MRTDTAADYLHSLRVSGQIPDTKPKTGQMGVPGEL